MMFANAWARAKRFRWSKSLTAGFIEGKFELGLPSRKWFGHSASKSLGSELTGVKGRALSVCSTRQKVVKSTSLVNSRLPKKARLQLLTSRSQPFLMRTSRRIELPCQLLMNHYRRSLLVPTFNTSTKLFFRTHKVSAVIRPYHWWRTTTCNESLNAHHTSARIQRKYNFQMYSACGQACQQESPSFFRWTSNFDKKGTEVVHAGHGKWRRLRC